MRKAKLSFDLFAQQHGNDGLFACFYRHPGSAILLQKQVSNASIAKIVGVSLPPFTALSRQGGYAHTLKGYFYTNLGGTLSRKGVEGCQTPFVILKTRNPNIYTKTPTTEGQRSMALNSQPASPE